MGFEIQTEVKADVEGESHCGPLLATILLSDALTAHKGGEQLRMFLLWLIRLVFRFEFTNLQPRTNRKVASCAHTGLIRKKNMFIQSHWHQYP